LAAINHWIVKAGVEFYLPDTYSKLLIYTSEITVRSK